MADETKVSVHADVDISIDNEGVWVTCEMWPSGAVPEGDDSPDETRDFSYTLPTGGLIDLSQPWDKLALDAMHDWLAYHHAMDGAPGDADRAIRQRIAALTEGDLEALAMGLSTRYDDVRAALVNLLAPEGT